MSLIFHLLNQHANGRFGRLQRFVEDDVGSAFIE